MEITIKSGTKEALILVLETQERRGGSPAAGPGTSTKRTEPSMKPFSFDDYRKALEGVGPKTRENILDRAQRDKNIEFPDFIRLCRLAFPDVP